MKQYTNLAVVNDDHENAVFFGFDGKRYSLECVETRAKMRELRYAWIDLESRSTEKYTYFQSFDWCMKWADVYAHEVNKNSIDEPQVYVLRSAEPDASGEALMIWPLCKTKSRAGIKVLITLGEPLGQYSGLMFDPDHFSVELGKEVVEQICASSECDAFTLNFFPVDSMLARILEGKGFADKSEQKSMILDLEGMESWEAYRNTLSTSNRKNRNKRKNKLSKLGDLTYDVFGSGDPEFIRNIDICLKLKQRWMEETGRREDVMSDPTVSSFLSSLGDADTKDDHNDTYIHVMSLDGRPIALELGMACKGHYYSYLGAIDLDFHKYSPGKIQIEMAQEWAKELGLKKFDFLNDPSGYKVNWTNEMEPLRSQYVPITSPGYLYCWMWKTSLKPKLKEMYHNFRPEDRRHFNQLFELIGKLQRPKSE